jgi:4-amino-4-deoxy-L-arabinose transferase-like glycosyltransferase
LGLLDATAYRVVFALAAAVGLVVAARLREGIRFPRLGEWLWWQWSLAVLIGVYVVLGILATSAPISSPDALLYHAADPALFERSERIFEIPWNASSYEPFGVEMLVLDGFLLWDSIQGAFAPFLLGLVALAAVVGAAERIAGRSVALLAGAIFFAQPFMAWESTSVFVEPGVTAVIALACWNGLRFIRHSERNALVLTGVFAGGAAGMKYLGLIGLLALVVTGLLLLRRRPTRVEAISFLLPAVVVALPWYVKNAVLTGNPFYPHVFGGLNSSAAADLENTLDAFGRGQGPLDLLFLPVRLLADGDAFDGGEFVSPLYLAFVPLALLLPRGRRPPLAIWIGLGVYLLAWFATTQQARFLLPVMPVLAVLAALGVLALGVVGRVGRLVAVGATAVALATGLAASSGYAAQFAPVVAGTESKPDFLRKKVSLYEGVEWLNVHLRETDKVALGIWSLLYLEVPYVTFGTMGDLLPTRADAAAVRAFVERNGVTHIAVLDTETARRRQIEALDPRLVARVSVRPVRSRTRSEFGPRRTMLVYVVGARP